MLSAPFVIRYDFTLPGPREIAFELKLDPVTLLNRAPIPDDVPAWAKLSCQQCKNCPLREQDSPTCPVAGQLVDVVELFAGMVSFEMVAVRVTVPERTYERHDVPVQVALSSLLGLYMVTSGCPVLAHLRPLARFHLPFASELETITRAVSMHLLEQYLRGQRGEVADWSLEALSKAYEATGAVNVAFAHRLRTAAPKDANVNALIRLDTFARAMPDSIESRLDELAFLFPRRA
jgi:hypothetical protein